MPHFVFANGNEIAAKSAHGASIAATPDTCLSPGAPYPGVPVPYPNTCTAKDLGNISTTVFLKGTGAALEDKSYFTTSYGDEPATPGMGKGLISTKIRGKCYFKTWSMNVKIEGLGVARHLDTVTHNHVNQPNALVQKYRSVWDKAAPCAQDRSEVEKHCKEKKPKDPNAKARKGFLQKLAKLASLPDEAAKKALLYKRTSGKNAWIDDHCDGLWVKPMAGTESFRNAQAEIEKFLGQGYAGIANTLVTEVLSIAKEKFGIGYIFRKAGGFAARSVLKNVVGGAAATTGIGLVVTGGMAAWTVADAVSTAITIAKDLGPQGLELIAELTSLDKIKDLLANKLKQWKDNPSGLMADLMTVDAAADACIRARKCMLIPFEKTDPLDAARTGEGCCPGQTGHHVMPGSMFGRLSNGGTDPAFSNPCSTAYDHGNAPTICLEGTNNTHGSHGVAHSALRTQIEDYQAKQAAGGPLANSSRMTYVDAREASLSAVKRIAPWCDIKCLRAQLDAFYKDCDKGSTKNLKPSYGGGRAEAGVVGTGSLN
jgi:hypothetical protein